LRLFAALPPIRAVRASSQTSRAAGHLRRGVAGGCAAGGVAEVQNGAGAGRGVCAGGCGRGRWDAPPQSALVSEEGRRLAVVELLF